MLYIMGCFLILQHSLTKSQPIDQGESSGKSGARFFLSQDKLYVVKSVTSEEVEAVHSVLMEYHQVL